MDAGRELDALVAKKVMRYTTRLSKTRVYNSETHRFEPDPRIVWVTPEGLGAGRQPPCYSTDIAAAWQVVEKMRQRWDMGDSTSDFWTIKDCGLTGWRVEVEFFPDHDAPTVVHEVVSLSLPHAICLAALKAVGHSDA